MRDPNCTPEECAKEPIKGDAWRGPLHTGYVVRRKIIHVTPLGNVIAHERGSGKIWIGPDELIRWCASATLIHRGDDPATQREKPE